MTAASSCAIVHRSAALLSRCLPPGGSTCGPTAIRRRCERRPPQRPRSRSRAHASAALPRFLTRDAGRRPPTIDLTCAETGSRSGGALRAVGVVGRCDRLAPGLSNLPKTHRDQPLYERLRQGTVDGKVEGALGHRVALELVGKLREDRAAERQVTQVISERDKAGDRLTSYAEGGNAVGDHLFGVWDDLENGPSQCLKRAALRLIDSLQVLVALLGRHPLTVYKRPATRGGAPPRTIAFIPDSPDRS